MKILKSILIGVSLFMASINSNAQSNVVVEWAPYKKLSNITDYQLVHAADNVNTEFLAKQKGFIKRELVKKSETDYADIIHWESKADAENAGSKVESCSVCLEYFKLMDTGAGESGAGFSYYSILKSW